MVASKPAQLRRRLLSKHYQTKNRATACHPPCHPRGERRSSGLRRFVWQTGPVALAIGSNVIGDLRWLSVVLRRAIAAAETVVAWRICFAKYLLSVAVDVTWNSPSVHILPENLMERSETTDEGAFNLWGTYPTRKLFPLLIRSIPHVPGARHDLDSR